MNALLELFNFNSPDYLPNLSEGLLVFLIGVATVFSVLAIILAILSFFNVFFGKASAKPKASTAPQAASVQLPATSADAEIIAVIAAAIAAAESENTGMKFRVVSFKRK